METLDRIKAGLVSCESGCMEWTGSRNDGYGQIKINGQTQIVHRVFYEMQVGPVPLGLELDHLCRNRACANPDHLEPVTHRENMRRYRNTVTQCKRGHAYDAANTITRPDGSRNCRQCGRDAQRRYLERRKQEA